MIVQSLQDKFLEIIAKHNNPKWAREELEWLVYDKYRKQYDELNINDRFTIDGYFASLIKIHGGN